MPECKKESKCKALTELEKRVDEHDERLAKGDMSFAVINVKLNLILGIYKFIEFSDRHKVKHTFILLKIRKRPVKERN